MQEIVLMIAVSGLLDRSAEKAQHRLHDSRDGEVAWAHANIRSEVDFIGNNSLMSVVA